MADTSGLGARHDVLIDRVGSAAVIRLNRPKALNSLTLGMVRDIKAALARFAGDDEVSCVVMKGEGERAFCAGGDVRQIHDIGKSGHGDPALFWREEFPLNDTISRYPKPYVALMDGIVMGGGVGLSAHGSHRVVTERTRLAMPEAAIGYIPDVGATWLLPKAPGQIGTWMALTGNSIGAADAIHAGLADCCVPSHRLAELVESLGQLPASARDQEVCSVLANFAVVPEPGLLSKQQDLIDRSFGFETVEEIIAALEKESGEFAGQTRDVLAKRSPTSLKLALRLLRLGRQSTSLPQCLEREFTVASAILRNSDFYEGVRAALVDKDRNPRWQPADLPEVGDADIHAYFEIDHPALFPDHGHGSSSSGHASA